MFWSVAILVRARPRVWEIFRSDYFFNQTLSFTWFLRIGSIINDLYFDIIDIINLIVFSK